MSLHPGQRLGVYEVVGPIGAGGMGEVYRARDTRLHREVALKILPEAFAFDPDRLARFEREAQVLATLNHPNIAAIYGLEHDAQTKALALELVDGPTLADRIAQGPLPVEDALPIARQIVDALEAAHEAGIVHRDLKPANVKLRPDGTVKVLDFGLAKHAGGAASVISPGVTASPTITTPAMTGFGTILGTAAYMAPEQARGRLVDKRADIWAFGCVLYEMLTGQRPFDGEDVSVVMASVIKSDPEWKAVPPDTPPAVRAVLRGCLEKDPKKRIRDIGDVRLALDGRLGATPETVPALAVVPRARLMRRALPWIGGVLAGAALAAAAAWTLGLFATPPAPVRRFTIAPPEGEQMPGGVGGLVAISPDGETIVFRTRVATGEFRLYRRSLGALEATPIGEPNAGAFFFFSDDGQWLAYFLGSTLKKVPVMGGPSQAIGELPANIRSGSWGRDGTIILGGTTAGLLRVAASGGTPEVILEAETGRGIWYPQMLPGGRAVLFTSSPNSPDGAQAELLMLDSGERRTLLPGSAARYLPTGHLVFIRGGTLWAAPFDVGRLETTGAPVSIVEGIRVEGGGAAQFAVSETGTLLYLPGGSSAVQRRLLWVDRAGRATPIDAPLRSYVYPKLSPDGSRLAVSLSDHEVDVWTWDFARRTLTRLTFGAAVETYPEWTRDGRRIIFSSNREDGRQTLFWQAADGTGSAERLVAGPGTVDQAVLSPDQTRVVVRAVASGSEDIMMVTLQGDRRLEPLIRTPFIERNANLSPDGRWVAYESNESGRLEIYVRPFPRVDEGRSQISTAGGSRPLWEPDGRGLIYLAPGGATMMRAAVKTGETFNADTPAPLFDVRPYFLLPVGRPFDISPDGSRFLMIAEPDDQGGDRMNVVVNWSEELKRLVPVD
jgi:serine/threonine-protein kinase